MDPITAILVNLIVLLVSTGASMLIAQMRGQDKKQVPGVRGTRQVGGTNPMAFIVGTYGTAGQFEYGGEWGNDGETPNAFRSEVYSYCDLPSEGLSGRFIAGAPVTLASAAHPTLGYPVLEYRVGGKDHLWFRDYTGMQTAADPLLLAKFGADPERPWKSDMVFPGVAYSVVTSLWNRELFAGAIPEPMFEDRGIWFYDVRRDGTAGGVGSHRLDDPSTWAWTDNPIVIIYGILLGIKYQGEWIWGGQDIEQHHLPYANWAAQMDKCDALVTIPGDGTEKRFRCGLEISVDSEPQAIIGEILKACEGKISENGGIYKVLVGEPDAPVVSVTPDDIVVSDPQTFDPFPGLENLFNEMRADYPEPGEAWEMKEAPPRLRSDLVAKDDGRRLPFSTSYKAVPFGHQVQRLMYAAIEETRRFGRLVKTHPPEFWEYEPLDTYLLTDPQDGFVNKQFLITAMDDLPNGNQVVGAQEVDPADYTPPPGFELPWDIVPLQIARPAPQPVSGEYVSPVPGEIAYDAHWSASSVGVDVEFVRVSHRLPGDANPRWSGLVPKPDLLMGEGRISQNLERSTLYEVQIEYVPYSGRATVASDWMTVTTADVRTGPSDLSAEVNAARAWAARSIEQHRADTDAMAALLTDALLGGAVDRQELRTEVTARFWTSEAKYDQKIELVAGELGALVTFTEDFKASFDTTNAAVSTSINAISSGLGALAGRTDTVEAAINDEETGLTAVAAAFAQFQSTVNDDLAAKSAAILAVEASIGEALAGGAIGIIAEVAPTGYDTSAYFAIRGVSTEGVFRAMGLHMRLKNDGEALMILDSDNVVFTGVARSESGLSFIDWTRGAMRLGG